ncbi:MAG: hypothetical protein Q7T96_10505 [Methylobacter sp.]|nr:hypothetical protein [Methylobacter sp.]
MATQINKDTVYRAAKPKEKDYMLNAPVGIVSSWRITRSAKAAQVGSLGKLTRYGFV